MSLHGIAADYLWSDEAEKTPRPLKYLFIGEQINKKWVKLKEDWSR